MCGLQHRWSPMAVVSQDRFHCSYVLVQQLETNGKTTLEYPRMARIKTTLVWSMDTRDLIQG